MMMDIASVQPWNLAVQPMGAVRGKDAAAAAGTEFEQLLVRQFLSEVRRGSLDGGGGSSAGYLQLADDQLAALVARVGGLGLGQSLRRWSEGVAAYRAHAG